MNANERGLALVDTNVIVYAHDPSDQQKHDVAIRLLEELSLAGRLVLSAQVLNEFCSVMMRPNRQPHFTPQQARDVVHDLCALGEVMPVTQDTTIRALAGMMTHRLSFWDAMIWATAIENHITTIYTEDMPGSAEIEGIIYRNPFAEEGA